MKSDVIIIGAGAAGMMCAATAAARGRSVLLLDHSIKTAEKIRISGGGRCNFTNLGASWENYVSENPRLARFVLSAYTAQDFIDLVNSYGIAWHEKHNGQLFCDDSSEDIIRLLKSECDRNGVRWSVPCSVKSIKKVVSTGRAQDEYFELKTSKGLMECQYLVIATGGMAIPQLGASDFGLKIARQFGLRVVEPKPALVPLVFSSEQWQQYSELSGISLPALICSSEVRAQSNKHKVQRFNEDILFTHKGLSGPGILQISSYWDAGDTICINLCPLVDLESCLLNAKSGSKLQLLSVLSEYLPKRLAQRFLQRAQISDRKKLAELPDKFLRQLVQEICQWQLKPSGTAGYKKAEAMRGGVATAELEQKTLQSKKVPGLYFIGEVVDMTGWLGGYNFQWAWSSAVVCGRAL